MFRRVAAGSARSDTAFRPSGMGSARGPMRTASKRGPGAPPARSFPSAGPTSCTSSGPPSSYRGGEGAGEPQQVPPTRPHPKHHMEIKFLHLASLSPFRICPQASADWVMTSSLSPSPSLESDIWLCQAFVKVSGLTKQLYHPQPHPSSPQSLALSPVCPPIPNGGGLLHNRVPWVDPRALLPHWLYLGPPVLSS